MKIGIFLETFTYTEIEKDPGLITQGLLERGHEITVFSCNPSTEVIQKFHTKKVNKQEINQKEYWEKSQQETIIIYSWLSIKYTTMIKAVHDAGVRVVLKLDSDGNLLHPLKPSYLKVFGTKNTITSKITHILRVVQWSLFPKLMSALRIKQIELADSIIIESPIAKENLSYSLTYLGREDLLHKIHVIPNPIRTKDVIRAEKKPVITCIGRWDDTRKNAPCLVQVFSSLKTNWEIRIIGHNSSQIVRDIQRINHDISIHAYEKLTHQEIFEKLAETKIFFVPSMCESFNLSAAEALCSGCSIVGGPLPSFRYFVHNGNSGTLATDTSFPSELEALQKDILKWQEGQYDPQGISSYWQKELAMEKISREIEQLCVL